MNNDTDINGITSKTLKADFRWISFLIKTGICRILSTSISLVLITIFQTHKYTVIHHFTFSYSILLIDLVLATPSPGGGGIIETASLFVVFCSPTSDRFAFATTGV